MSYEEPVKEKSTLGVRARLTQPLIGSARKSVLDQVIILDKIRRTFV